VRSDGTGISLLSVGHAVPADALLLIMLPVWYSTLRLAVHALTLNLLGLNLVTHGLLADRLLGTRVVRDRGRQSMLGGRRPGFQPRG